MICSRSCSSIAASAAISLGVSSEEPAAILQMFNLLELNAVRTP
jgi:hypothetical protein